MNLILSGEVLRIPARISVREAISDYSTNSLQIRSHIRRHGMMIPGRSPFRSSRIRFAAFTDDLKVSYPCVLCHRES